MGSNPKTDAVLKPAVFLDRDGVINELVDRGGKKTPPWNHSELRIKDGVTEALQELNKVGLLKILVTNQPDVVYGNMPQLEHDKIMDDIKKLPLDDIFICPHKRDEGCECKKPKPGMLLEAAKKWGIDLQSSFMVGDGKSDVEAGRAAGCKTILIDHAQNKSVVADMRVKNLSEAVKYIQYEDFY